MIQVLFRFADGVRVNNFKSTFSAYCAILNAFNMYEEYFIGAKTDKYLNILDVEKYVSEITPVKEYLEIAALAGFEDSQILEETNCIFHQTYSEIPSSWKQHMSEFNEALVEFTQRVADKVHKSLK